MWRVLHAPESFALVYLCSMCQVLGTSWCSMYRPCNGAERLMILQDRHVTGACDSRLQLVAREEAGFARCSLGVILLVNAYKVLNERCRSAPVWSANSLAWPPSDVEHQHAVTLLMHPSGLLR